MIGIKLSEAKGMFFDRPAVMSATDRAQRKVLSRFGAFVRRTARSSIRKRKKPSPPGQPPSSHEGTLKKHIYFLYSPNSRSVIIGPVLLRAKGTDAPRVLEEGGSVTRRRRKRRYRPRPYMGPAFQKEHEQHMPQMWKDSVQ